MKRINSIEDEMQRRVTYELSNGYRVHFDLKAVEEFGAEHLIQGMGLGHLLPSARVPVWQDGREIGTVPGTFDPLNIKSKSFLYDVRPGDFRYDLENNRWIANRTLGPGDLESVPGFSWSES